MKKSDHSNQKEESKLGKNDTVNHSQVINRMALIFRAQNYKSINKDNLWEDNKDFNEIKKHFIAIKY